MKNFTLKLAALMLMLIGGINLTTAQDVTVDGIDYTLGDGIATVMKGTYSGNLVIPEYIEVDGTYYDVTAVADRCFRDNHDLESVTFKSESVDFLGVATFENCENLHTIEMPAQSYQLGDRKSVV